LDKLETHVASLDAEHELAMPGPGDLFPEPDTAPSARRMVLNMGPQHPSTHGVLRVLLELDGETILRARPEIGYLHTGIEKECEVEWLPSGVLFLYYRHLSWAAPWPEDSSARAGNGPTRRLRLVPKNP
jgi:hypothetical protein